MGTYRVPWQPRFYEEVKQLFWQRHATVAHLLKDKVKHVKPHEFHLPKW